MTDPRKLKRGKESPLRGANRKNMSRVPENQMSRKTPGWHGINSPPRPNGGPNGCHDRSKKEGIPKFHKVEGGGWGQNQHPEVQKLSNFWGEVYSRMKNEAKS